MTSKDAVIRGQEWAGMALVRENERLRADIERLKLQTDWGDIDELRAKVERYEQRFREAEAEWVERFQALEAENEQLRAALQSIADNPDPLEGKCYCRWSQGVARQAIGLTSSERQCHCTGCPRKRAPNNRGLWCAWCSPFHTIYSEGEPCDHGAIKSVSQT